MDEEAGFISAILANPGDDTPRLVYADWLQEHAVDQTCGSCDAGRVYVRDPRSSRRADAWHSCPRCGGTGRLTDGRISRAEFIRVQCELTHLSRAQRSDGATPERTARQTALLQREAQLTVAVYPRVVWPVKDWLRKLDIDTETCVFDRGGWLTEVTCSAPVWLEHGDAIRGSHPVTAVRLTTLFGSRDIKSDEGEWWFVTTPSHKMRNEDYNLKVAELEDAVPNPARHAALACRWPGITFTLPT